MIQPSPSLKKLLLQSQQTPSPQLRPEILLLCRLAASRAAMTVDAWLDHVLRLAAAHATPEVVRKLVFETSVHGLEVGEVIPAIDASVALSPFDLLRGDVLVKLLELQIPALTVLDASNDERPIPPNSAHRLLDKPFVAPPDTRDTDTEKSKWLKALQHSGSTREIPKVTPRMLRQVLSLNERAPHLREATERVASHLRLQLRGSRHLELPHLLLVGEPGCGKSWWAQELSTLLGVSHRFQSMPSVTGSFEITGSNRGWSSAQPGLIVRQFLETRCATPMFILDEIDKMNGGNYDPRPCLLGLLEPSTAKRFRDEFMDMEFDVSKCLFVATANSTAEIAAPLLHRFTVIHVPMPTAAQRLLIIEGFWSALRKERQDLRLPEVLPEEVTRHLAAHFESVRSLRGKIMTALGEAARRRGRLQLTRFDFN